MSTIGALAKVRMINYREEVHQKLSSFLYEEFQARLNEELKKFSNDLTFVINHEGWNIRTSMACNYATNSWAEDTDNEVILAVDVVGQFYFNNLPIKGFYKIRFISDEGFLNLGSKVEEVISIIKQKDEQKSIPSELNINRIMNTEYQTPTTFNAGDVRLHKIVEQLSKMNISHKKSTELSQLVLAKNPCVHDIDLLVEEALNIME